MASAKILSTTYINPLSVTGDFYLGYTSTGGTFTIGHNTPASDGGTLIINRSTTYNKNISMLNNNIQFTSGGQISINIIRGVSFGDGISLYLSQTGAISFGNNLGTGGGITLNDNTTLASNRNLILQGTGKITTPNILVSGLTASKMVLTDGSDNLISSLYTDTDFPRLTADNTFSGTTNTFSNTISCNTISGTLLGNVTLYGSGLGTISLGSFLGGGISIFDNTTLGLNKNLTLQGTGKITTPAILVSGLSASKMVLTDGSDNLVSSIYTDTDFGRLTANNTFSGNNIFSGTSTFNNTILGNTLTGTTTGSLISLFGTTTAGISLGSGSSSGITINDTTTFNTGKDLLFSSTGRIRTDRIVGSTPLTSDINIGYTDPLYTAIIQLNQNVRVNRISASKMVLTDSNKQLVSSSWTDTDFVLKGGSTMTGTLNCDNIQGTTTSSSITLFTNSSVSSPTITLGNTSGGNLIINPNVVLPANKTITLNSTGGKVICNSFDGTTASSNISLFTGTYMGSATITIGSSIVGNLNINPTTVLASGKNLVLSSTGKIVVNTIEGSVASDTISLFGTTSTGSINLGTNLSSGSVNISTTATTGNVNISNIDSTGLVTIGGKVKFSKAFAQKDTFFNIASGTSLFSTSALTGKQLSSNISANAPTEEFNIWETNAQGSGGDASFIAQNGTIGTIICNPADATYSLFWIDEDEITTASNWAVTNGWRINLTGTISSLSDARTKRNIKTISKVGILDKLENIDIVSFQKVRPTHVTRVTKKYDAVFRGYTAQDLQANGFDEVITADESGTMSVNYTEMNLFWFSGVQKLIKQNKQQQKQIDDLTARLVRLEQLILNP